MNEIVTIIGNIILTVIVGVLSYLTKKKSEEQEKEIKKVQVQSSTVERRITNIFNEIKNEFTIITNNDTNRIDRMLKDFANLKAHLNERIGTQIQLDLDIKQCMLLLSRAESKLDQHTQIIKSHHARMNEINKKLDIIMPPKSTHHNNES